MTSKYYLPNEATTGSLLLYNAAWDAYLLRTSDEPTTTADMKAMFKWEHGDVLHGTYAKSHKAMADYRRDIDTDWGTEDDYLDIYIDTFKDEPIGPRLEKGDR